VSSESKDCNSAKVDLGQVMVGDARLASRAPRRPVIAAMACPHRTMLAHDDAAVGREPRVYQRMCVVRDGSIGHTLRRSLGSTQFDLGVTHSWRCAVGTGEVFIGRG
jgi:hypothetical protein